MARTVRVINTAHVGTPIDVQTTREEYRDSLYRRLEVGYARIERGIEAGQDMKDWEDFWIALLHEYEEVCDGLRRDLAA